RTNQKHPRSRPCATSAQTGNVFLWTLGWFHRNGGCCRRHTLRAESHQTLESSRQTGEVGVSLVAGDADNFAGVIDTLPHPNRIHDPSALSPQQHVEMGGSRKFIIAVHTESPPSLKGSGRLNANFNEPGTSEKMD